MSKLFQRRPETARESYIQPALEIGDEQDQYEQEANEVADKVMRMKEDDGPKMKDPEEGIMKMKDDDGPRIKDPEAGIMKMKDPEAGIMKMKDPYEGMIKPMVDSYEGKIKKMMDPYTPEWKMSARIKEAEKMSPLSHNIKRMSTGKKNDVEASAQVEQGIQQSKGGGQHLSADVQAEMGNKIGADFSEVKVHTDEQAKSITNNLIDEDEPEVTGKEKQGDVSENGIYVFIEGGDGNKRSGFHGKWVKIPSALQVNEGYEKVKKIISEAKKQGAIQAAKNLEHWLQGGGGVFNPDYSWLKTVKVFEDARIENKTRFFDFLNSNSESLRTVAKSLKENETKKFKDLWDKSIWAIAYHFPGTKVTPDLDFAFAYGTSVLKSLGSFTLTRKGSKVIVVGTIIHNFIDKYDWELGLNVTLGGEVVKDEDMKLMEVYKGARPFDVNYSFSESINTTM